MGLHPSERFPLEEPVTSRCQCPPDVTAPAAGCNPGNEAAASRMTRREGTPGKAAPMQPTWARSHHDGDPPKARPEGRGATRCERRRRGGSKRCPKAPRKTSSSLPVPTARHPAHRNQPPACSEERTEDRCPRALPVSIRRRPKPLPNRGTPMRPNPDRRLRRGRCRRGSSERETRMPNDRETRWPKPHEAVAPRCTMCRNRTKAKPAVAPPKRAVRDPNAQPPLQAAAPATHPTATKSTTSAAIIDDATAAPAPPEDGSSTCGRCWSEDHRALGATSPKKGRGNRTADG